jgi:hypothetical protein
VGTRLVNATGSGSVLDDSVISFGYSEDVTSLEPSNLEGGVGQVNFTAIAVNEERVGNTHPASKFLINNNMVLTNDEYGSINFQVKDVSIGNQTVDASGVTLHERLNVEKTAGPHGGTGATLWTAIIYYCSLVDILPEIGTALQDELDAIPVNFIGWQGNVWEHLKMLCAGVSISTTDNVGLEMFIDQDTLVFRKALQTEIDLSERYVEVSLSINSQDTAKSLDINRYATSYGVDKVIQEESRQDITGKTEYVSIADQMQVDAGETLVKRFKINASLESINQPVAVGAITVLPYPENGTGEYVIVGNDDLPVSPEQWQAQGGSVTVKITENPNEIEVVIVAPPAPSLELADDPAELTFAPYKIGVESSGEEDYPAFYISGTGVFFEKKTKRFITGASDDYTAEDTATEVDNPFITSKFNQSTRGVAAAQANCGPEIDLSITVDGGLQFGATIGSKVLHQSAIYRISSISFSDSEPSFTAKNCTNFSDFNSIWATATFANFTATALDPATYPNEALTFNEFSVVPLMERA